MEFQRASRPLPRSDTLTTPAPHTEHGHHRPPPHHGLSHPSALRLPLHLRVYGRCRPSLHLLLLPRSRHRPSLPLPQVRQCGAVWPVSSELRQLRVGGHSGHPRLRTQVVCAPSVLPPGDAAIGTAAASSPHLLHPPAAHPWHIGSLASLQRTMLCPTRGRKVLDLSRVCSLAPLAPLPYYKESLTTLTHPSAH